METRLNMFERLIKSSILGLILPPMLCLLCDRKLHTLAFSENLLQVGFLALDCYFRGLLYFLFDCRSGYVFKARIEIHLLLIFS